MTNDRGARRTVPLGDVLQLPGDAVVGDHEHMPVVLWTDQQTLLPEHLQGAGEHGAGLHVDALDVRVGGEIRLQPGTLKLIQAQTIAKGNVLASARLAGILAAKKTGELIPLCHPLPLTHCEVNFEIPKTRDRIVVTASSKIAAQTGASLCDAALATANLGPDRRFYFRPDGIHFNERGDAFMGDFVASCIAAAIH